MSPASEAAMAGKSAAPRYWTTPAIGLTLLVGLAFLLIGLRAIIAPTAMSTAFGLPMVTANETAFVQVYGSRTIALALLALGLLWRRELRSLALLLTIAAPLPLFDAWLLASRHGIGPELWRHAGYFILLTTLVVLLRRMLARDGTGRG